MWWDFLVGVYVLCTKKIGVTQYFYNDISRRRITSVVYEWQRVYFGVLVHQAAVEE